MHKWIINWNYQIVFYLIRIREDSLWFSLLLSISSVIKGGRLHRLRAVSGKRHCFHGTAKNRQRNGWKSVNIRGKWPRIEKEDQLKRQLIYGNPETIEGDSVSDTTGASKKLLQLKRTSGGAGSLDHFAHLHTGSGWRFARSCGTHWPIGKWRSFWIVHILPWNDFWLKSQLPFLRFSNSFHCDPFWSHSGSYSGSFTGFFEGFFCHSSPIVMSLPILPAPYQDSFRILSGFFQDSFRILSGFFQDPFRIAKCWNSNEMQETLWGRRWWLISVLRFALVSCLFGAVDFCRMQMSCNWRRRRRRGPIQSSWRSHRSISTFISIKNRPENLIYEESQSMKLTWFEYHLLCFKRLA